MNEITVYDEVRAKHEGPCHHQLCSMSLGVSHLCDESVHVRWTIAEEHRVGRLAHLPVHVDVLLGDLQLCRVAPRRLLQSLCHRRQSFSFRLGLHDSRFCLSLSNAWGFE